MESLWHCEKLPMGRNTFEPLPGNCAKTREHYRFVSNQKVVIQYTAASMGVALAGRRDGAFLDNST
jgi:hypothetical protein